MSLPKQQDWADEHDGTFAVITSMRRFAANPNSSILEWGLNLWLCLHRLHICFARSTTDQMRWIYIENLDLAPFQLLFDFLDRAFVTSASTSRCTIVWCRHLMPRLLGETTFDPDGNITIKIDVRQCSASEILLTVLHEIGHGLLDKQCCRGSCGSRSCLLVWNAMDGHTGHGYYWHMIAAAIEDLATYCLGVVVDMDRHTDALVEMLSSRTIPAEAYIGTVLRPRQVASIRYWIAHRLRRYDMNSLLRWGDMDMWGNQKVSRRCAGARACEG